LGKNFQIGVTCHNSRHLAMDAAEAGADYVAFGAFHPTTTKQTEHRAELDTLEKWSSVTEIPCVAIGGITIENAMPIITAGADFIAVCSAIWNDPRGPAVAVADFNAVLASAPPRS
jgi:thiamine-phosphate pyrophosphorylase